MRIAIDAMGGDHAPADIVKGAVDAARSLSRIDRLFLVGDETAIRKELETLGTLPDSVAIQHASEVVGMNEAPAVAIRRKRDSSISVCMDLIKSGRADAAFSAGNTGAAVAASTLKLRTLKGIDRPAIAVVIPTPSTPCVLLDAGANTDCPPEWLCQFAAMGAAYARAILKCENPSIGLLSIGEEDAKGNETTKEVFRRLEKSSLNFAGNVESRDIFDGKVDVVVCDGFVGNVVLKTSEAVARTMGRWIKAELTRNPLIKVGAAIVKRGLDRIKEKADPETYGGAPLLGVNGACIIGHGSSSPTAVRNAIHVSAEWVRLNINTQIEQDVVQFEGKG